MLVFCMSMAFVACSSAAESALVTGEKTSRTPLVRLGSNIMLRLRTLTFSQPGYRLEMLTDTTHREMGNDDSLVGQSAKMFSKSKKSVWCFYFYYYSGAVFFSHQ